ncbi:MAG: V-type ATP synthase subunit D [Saprospiraceae bacterium]|nr:V-type ATP synthase subunit D [Saprospiraceae bacterium]MBK6564599.1 V-type ATP synthase subunit D [Saprospiraceae bacterium]MBK8079333.1 V-type ATP synthase subunit D [Saprospiraceae bacterium]MBK8819516.1 V-type ATP synthase subunit D [Saprospiraceae bacterium]
MAFVFQYNNVSKLHLQHQMEMRERALPVLKSKESALRVEVKKTKLLFEATQKELEIALLQEEDFLILAGELDTSLIYLDYVEVETISIAGVKVPKIGKIHFKRQMFNIFVNPYWFIQGFDFIEKITILKTRLLYLEKRFFLLEKARKKTTQKVNLYEKNQIPELLDLIRKIKHFLEDEENLSKSSQKILKSTLESKSFP